KYRYVFLPPGTSAQYSATGPFDFPVGTIISKTFTLPLNTGIEKLVETRLLIRRASGWSGVAYIWDEALTEATLALGGGAVSATVLDPDGNEVAVDYRIPNANQCTNCHGVRAPGDSAFRNQPIGPKARFLNRDYHYAGGSANQLVQWSAMGLLTGAPAPQNAPRLP